jgi:hypothetical protein
MLGDLSLRAVASASPVAFPPSKVRRRLALAASSPPCVESASGCALCGIVRAIDPVGCGV